MHLEQEKVVLKQTCEVCQKVIESGSPECSCARVKATSTVLLNGNVLRAVVPTILGDRYEILRLIASGGMSDVYEVRDKESGATVVAKVLKPGLLSNRVVQQRFKQEAELLQQLNHSNIIKVREYAVAEDQSPYLIMECLDGITLEQYIKQQRPVPLKQAIIMFAQIAQALTHAHSKGIVHRDIKPSNVLLVKSSKDLVVKVMDFGIAKILESDDHAEGIKNQTASILGKAAYMSPEQCLGEAVDARTDVYAFGCLMYETLTAKHPFVASTPVGTILNHLEMDAEPLRSEEFIKLKIPEHVDHCIAKCLSKDPDARYQTVDDVQQAMFPKPSLVRRLCSTSIDFLIVSIIIGLSQSLPLPGFQETLRLNTALQLQLICLIYTAYFTAFEASSLQGTPGKLILGLRVANLKGGSPPLVSCAGRALSFCALVLLLYISISAGQASEALDYATGSHFAVFLPTDGWLGYFIGLYVFYTGFRVFSQKEQWHVDTFFGRTIISHRLAAAQSKTTQGAKLAWSQLALTIISLAAAISIPIFAQWLHDEAWSNPLVTKDRTVIAAVPINKGRKLTRRHFSFRPELRTGNPERDYHLYDPNALVGREVTTPLPQGSSIDYFDIKDHTKLERGAPYWVQIGYRAEKDGDRGQAELNYAKAVKLDPAEKEGWLGLARLYEQRGWLQRSNDARQRAKDIFPVNSIELARQLTNLGAYNESLSLARGVIAKDPANYDMLREMARAMDGLGADSSAERIYEQLVAARPNDSFSLARIAAKLHQRGQNASAKQLAVRATQLNPNDVKSWQVLSAILSKLDEPKAAATAFERARNLDPQVRPLDGGSSRSEH